MITTTIILNGMQIRNLDTGFLDCVVCRDFWCDHIQSLVTSNADSQAIWNPDLGGALPTQLVEIPVVPSAALWTTATLTLMSKLGAYKVTFEEGAFEQFLGFIHPGEGRLILRSMMIEWFYGHVDSSELRCPMSSHSFPSQLRWDKDMMQRRTAFAQLFSVWSNQKCLGCLGTSVTNFDDVVPEADPRGGPWHA